jgi:hypothetical protein
MYPHVHAIGDSHVLHMGGLFAVHHICDDELQGATAHNLVSDTSKTQSKAKLAAVLDTLDPATEILLFSFGEVDCRLHLRTDEQVDATIERYTQAIESVRTRGFRVIVHSVIGAVPQDNTFRQADYPSQDARAVVVRRFNAALKEWCDTNSVEFLTLPVDDDGVLLPAFCDDDVHLNDKAIPLYEVWARGVLGLPRLMDAVWCVGALSTHGQNVARALGWPLFVETPIGNDIGTVLIVGMYDPPDYDFTLRCTKRARRRVVYFCGTDVSYLSKPEMLPDATYLCETEGIQAELREKGVEASVVLFPTILHPEVTPLPEKPTVAFYVGNDARKYGAHYIDILQEALPDVDFIVYGINHHSPAEMYNLVNQSSAYIRLTEHDGGAASAREFMEGGRRAVITSDFPYAEVVTRSNPVALVSAVRKALKETEPDWDSAAYYHAVNSVERFRSELAEVLDA